MKFRAILFVLVVVQFIMPLHAQSPGFVKDPAISPDGEQVCFVYANELWLVSFKGGQARRITNTDAQNWGPIWSPDGEWIAFKSNREGRTYSYIMPSTGGDAKPIIRETFSVVDWFNDGKHLLAIGYGYEFGSSFYKLPVNGERPILLGEIGEYWASLSRDNKKIVFSRYGDAHREAQTGSKNGDLFLFDIASKSYTRLTKTEFTERYPVFSHYSNSMFYTASDGNCFQIMRVDDLDFDRVFRTSDFKRFSARDLSIARANDRIVFEHFNEIYKYDPTKLAKDRIEKLQIDIATDLFSYPIREINMKNEIEDYSVSDDNRLVTFNYKYDNFVVPVKGGAPKALTTDHSGWAKAEFLTDTEIVLIKLHEGRFKLFKTKVGQEITLEPVPWFGADSLSVRDINRDANGRWQMLYVDHKNSGRIALVEDNFTKFIPMDIPEPVISNFAINSSGTHAAYTTIDDRNYIRSLYIYDFVAKTHRKVLSDQFNISNIWWSKDNRSLIFTRARNIHRLDLVPRDEFEYETDPWDEILAPMPELLDSTSTEPAPEAPDGQTDDGEESSDEDSSYLIDIVVDFDTPLELEKPVVIVWEGIDKRMFEIYKGQNSTLYPVKILSDSTFYYLDIPWLAQTKPSLRKGDVYGKNSKEEASFPAESSRFRFFNSMLYYLEKGALKSFDTTSSKRNDINISLEYSYNVKTLNQRVFEQVWGNFLENFYDPNMHNQDWHKLYREYLPYTDKALDINEIGSIIDEMVGDLNASHTGFTPRQEHERRFKSQAFLGIEFDRSERLKQGIRISRVYPTTRLAAFYGISDGDILTSLDGVIIQSHTPVDSLLTGKVDKQIKFTIQKGDQEISGQVTGLSGSAARELWYQYQVNRNRQKVEAATAGRVGYIHVPAMGESNYDDFYRDYFRDNFDKEAVILDFRGNRGGRVHDDIISLLTKTPYAYSARRNWGNIPRVEPRAGIYVPTIVLVDEDSFSDGEIFPNIYQYLKVGKVVGYPSSGAVIGTWPVELLDGSSMRMPGTGWYKVDGTNMEGTGVMPDIVVEHSLNDIISNNDLQLQRAIAEILKEITE